MLPIPASAIWSSQVFLALRQETAKLSVTPIIPQDWEYFRVTNLAEKNVTVLYDRTGGHYGMGAGLHILA